MGNYADDGLGNIDGVDIWGCQKVEECQRDTNSQGSLGDALEVRPLTFGCLSFKRGILWEEARQEIRRTALSGQRWRHGTIQSRHVSNQHLLEDEADQVEKRSRERNLDRYGDLDVIPQPVGLKNSGQLLALRLDLELSSGVPDCPCRCSEAADRSGSSQRCECVGERPALSDRGRHTQG